MANRGKLKTHKGAKRRFKITATGKIMHAKGMKSHRRRKKAPRVKRQFDKMLEMHPSTAKRVKKMLPNGL
ncbi:MAG TPA: 50S ribosomal protein L35 [Thermomicrobiales bacterium]|jgi:large subunit ribosomal protein L35|nr:50S ribosomal protein L35 [Thermomicrobiales bacterium]HYH13247.1 50S ribosomal protein L35 [Thermomicrobiales bacterium]